MTETYEPRAFGLISGKVSNHYLSYGVKDK